MSVKYFAPMVTETIYHWFFLLKITVVKIMNNLNVCSAHSYLYPRPRFKLYLKMPITNCEAERNFSKLSLIYKEQISAHHDWRAHKFCTHVVFGKLYCKKALIWEICKWTCCKEKKTEKRIFYKLCFM